jgi:ABC-2 type transport system ATP-binding protein
MTPASTEPPSPDRVPVLDLRQATVGSVLRSVDLFVGAGSIVGVIGPPGSGKSTLLAVMAGVLRLDDGRRVGNPSLAYLPEASPLDPGLRVARWLRLAEHLPGWDTAYAAGLLQGFGIDPRHPVRKLSLEDRVAFGLVLALARRAPLYVLDEPFGALGPGQRDLAFQAIRTRVAEGSGVVVGSDAFDAMERLAPDVLVLLRRGSIVLARPLAEWRLRFKAVELHQSPTRYKGRPSPILGERKVGGKMEAVFDDKDDTLDQWFGALGIQVAPSKLPLHHILATVVQACEQVLS